MGHRARRGIARGARYKAIYRYRKQFKITDACAYLGVSASAYYAWIQRLSRADPDQARIDLVREAYDCSRMTYGYRRIQIWIKREYDIQINHKAVLRIMNKLNIQSIARRKNPYRQIQNQYGAIHTYPNILKQNFKVQRPNQTWGTDITYIRTQKGFVYLAIVKDFFDGTILGYALSGSFSIRMVLQALRLAAQNSPSRGVVLHSDQGPQYQSSAYHSLTTECGITPSMSRRGNCLDNAPTESFFSQLKEEVLRHIKIRDLNEATQLVDDYIHFYNNDRIQLKTKLTPVEFRCQFV